MKVLVTGGCGLIGFHAAKYYKEQGHTVEVMDNLERSSLLGHFVSQERKHHNLNLLEGMDIPVYQYDISVQSSWQLMNGHDVIIHCAGQCGVPTSIENPRRDFEVNVLGTFNGLEYAKKCGAKFVFASTNKVYPIHDAFVKKDDRWHFINPNWAINGFPVVNNLVGSRTPYGWSKYSADLLCQEYYHSFGVKTGVFRMSCIYGPNQFGFEEQGWATWFIIATEKDLPITIYGDGCQVRDMLYVEDCIKAYDAFVQSPRDHVVVNLGGGMANAVSLNETLDYLAKLTAKRSPIKYEGWRPSDQNVYVSDLRETNRLLNWMPETHPIEGLKKTLEWVRKNIDLF